jgi:UrcA family protein
MKTAVTLYTLFLALSATVFGPPALATDKPPQRVVQYGDLNLASSKGVQTLYGRLTAAARIVCAPAVNLGYYQKAEASVCTKKAVQDAVRDVNNANLTAFHLERTGQAGEREKLASRK